MALINKTILLSFLLIAMIAATLVNCSSNSGGSGNTPGPNTIHFPFAGSLTYVTGKFNTHSSVDGNLAAATFSQLNGIVGDSHGNFFVSDQYAIRMISTTGEVTTFAGSLSSAGFGSADGQRTDARFYSPQSLAIDAADNLYVADGLNRTIRKIEGDTVSTLAGSANNPGSADGAATTTARFGEPAGIAVTSAGVIYVADAANHTIRKIEGGTVSTLAGTSGQFGSSDGTGAQARFKFPGKMTLTNDGNLIVVDQFNQTIRKVTPAGVVSTLAGTVGVSGFANGVGTSAMFSDPSDVCADDSGNIYVSDAGNSVVRLISSDGTVSSPIGTAGVFEPLNYSVSALPGILDSPVGISCVNGKIVISTSVGLIYSAGP